jgi:hypothetical protein
LLLVLALAGCGGKAKSPAVRIADCLNGKGFLVQPATGQIVGTSPRGVAFTVTVGGRIADGGNPGGRRLSGAERRAIRGCLH